MAVPPSGTVALSRARRTHRRWLSFAASDSTEARRTRPVGPSIVSRALRSAGASPPKQRATASSVRAATARAEGGPGPRVASPSASSRAPPSAEATRTERIEAAIALEAVPVDIVGAGWERRARRRLGAPGREASANA